MLCECYVVYPACSIHMERCRRAAQFANNKQSRQGEARKETQVVTTPAVRSCTLQLHDTAMRIVCNNHFPEIRLYVCFRLTYGNGHSRYPTPHPCRLDTTHPAYITEAHTGSCANEPSFTHTRTFPSHNARAAPTNSRPTTARASDSASK